MRTQNLTTTLFPLFVLSGLAALAFWLKEATTLSMPSTDAKKRHDPDAIVEKPVIYRYDMSGELRYRLTAERMEHYPDDDSSLIHKPRFVSYRPHAPEVMLTGENALITTKGERIVLRENVILTRAAYADRVELVAKTQELTVLPEENKAFNRHPVTITQGRSWLNGIGLLVDNNNGLFSLNQSVRGQYIRSGTPENGRDVAAP